MHGAGFSALTQRTAVIMWGALFHPALSCATILSLAARPQGLAAAAAAAAQAAGGGAPAASTGAARQSANMTAGCALSRALAPTAQTARPSWNGDSKVHGSSRLALEVSSAGWGLER